MKKLLALVLALVMTMSLVTISNAAFKDADKISNKEAVDVMAAVGVLAGYDNGEFGATDTLTRAQACKIIAYLDLGKDVAEALPAVQVFSDLSANNWAAKYVAYCADAGYVSGVGDNKFAPDEKVTGYQFGKMLLCALGYDQKVEEMTGSSWEIKVAKLMESNSLSKGTSKLGSAALTREEAAQYGLNALKATCVEYEDKGTNITIGDTTISAGAKKAKAVEAATTNDYAGAIDKTNGSTAAVYTVQLGEKLYKGDLEISEDGTNGADEFGRTVKTWLYKKDAVATSESTAVASFTAATKAADVAKALNGYKLADNAGTPNKYNINNNTVYKTADPDNDFTTGSIVVVNNASATTLTVGTSEGETIAKAIADETANGKVVEIYADKDTKVVTKIVVIKYTVAKVTDVKTTTKSGSTYTTYSLASVEGSNTPSGKVYSVVADNEKDTAVVSGTIAKDDIVTYVKPVNGKLYIYATEKFTGTQSAKNSEKLTINGTSYGIALGVLNGNSSDNVDAADFANTTKTSNYYADQYGFVVYTNAVAETVNYAVVDKIALVNATGTGNNKSVEAVLAFADGTTNTVKVTKINGIKAKNIENAAGDIVVTSNAISGIKVSTSVTENGELSGKIVSYKSTSDGYELTYLNVSTSDGSIGKVATSKSSSSNSATTVTVVEKGVPTVVGYNKTDASNATGVVANNDTVYLIKTKDGSNDKFTSYTGFKNVSTVKITGTDSADAIAVVAYAVNDDGVAFIYINAATAVIGDTKDGTMLYVTGTDYVTNGTDDDVYYTLTGIVDGAEGEIKTKESSIVSGLEKGKLYELTVDNDGYVTAKTEQTSSTKYVKKTLSSASEEAKNGVIAGYTYDGTETVVVIEDNALSSGSVSSAKNGDTIYVKVVDSTGTAAEKIAIKTIYIVKA